MTVFVYSGPTTRWEIWECGGQAVLYDGEDPEVLDRLLAAKWSRVHTFDATNQGTAMQFFEHWVAQQVPPIGSQARVRDYLADLQIEAVH